jgi:hypothetical protein
MDQRAVNVCKKNVGRRILASVAAAVLVAGCSGGSNDTDNVLTVGTTYYIDSLNPFVGIETQTSTAYAMIYPQLVQYGPGFKMEGDWAEQ